MLDEYKVQWCPHYMMEQGQLATCIGQLLSSDELTRLGHYHIAMLQKGQLAEGVQLEYFWRRIS